MAGRPIQFDANDAIRKASEIFWKKGYEASSTEELLSAMGIGKASFYLHLKGGKKELYHRSLNLFSDDAMARFNKKKGEAENEIEFLKNFLLSLADKKEEQKQKGIQWIFSYPISADPVRCRVIYLSLIFCKLLV